MIDREEFVKKMNKLKRVYDACIGEWVIELEGLQKKSDKWTIDDTTALQTIVHKLTGTGSTYGYPNITDAARSLEYKLAYANVEFKTGGKSPNTNPYVINELNNLIYICSRIHAENQVARMEREMYGDEVDEFLETQKKDKGRKTILLVDDHEIIRQTVGEMLRVAGFNVVVASDGDDALLLMDKMTPDLVVLDRMMPHLDGMMVLKTMRRRAALEHIPVIFLTAVYNPDDILAAEKLGAVGYVTKPFDIPEFVLRCVKTLQPPPPAKKS